MATSGTTAQTVISTAKLLEHAWRRCKLSPTTQTPEQVRVALESLHTLINYLANRGINLWTVTSHYLSLTEGKQTYQLPPGTLSLLNVVHHIPSIASDGVITVGGTLDYQVELPESVTVTHLSLKLDNAPNGPLSFEYSDDGVTWEVFKTMTVAEAPLSLTWYALDPRLTGSFFKVTDTGLAPNLSVNQFSLAQGTSELTMTPFNRDQYVQQPRKALSSGPCTNYFFERLLEPQVSCWPVPNSDLSFLNVWVHQEVQDVGSLSQELAVPSRWMEAIITHWALRIALETPTVDDARISLLKGLADEMVLTSELDETDHSPIQIYPRIRQYTR